MVQWYRTVLTSVLNFCRSLAEYNFLQLTLSDIIVVMDWLHWQSGWTMTMAASGISITLISRNDFFVFVGRTLGLLIR